MTTGYNWVTAGLVFLGAKDIDIVVLSNRVRQVFDAVDQHVSEVRILSDSSTMIKSRYFDICLELQEDQSLDMLDHPVPLFLETKVSRTDCQTTARLPQEELITAHLLHTLHAYLAADYVKWTTAGPLINAHDFAMATASLKPPQKPVAPKQPNRRVQLPEIEETNEILQARLLQRDVQEGEAEMPGELRSVFRETPADSGTARPKDDKRGETSALRLSIWFVSFTVAIFSLPVGAALIVFNFLKGENLRLTSQTAALTGVFIAFQSYGATAQAMQIFQNLLH